MPLLRNIINQYCIIQDFLTPDGAVSLFPSSGYTRFETMPEEQGVISEPHVKYQQEDGVMTPELEEKFFVYLGGNKEETKRKYLSGVRRILEAHRKNPCLNLPVTHESEIPHLSIFISEIDEKYKNGW